MPALRSRKKMVAWVMVAWVCLKSIQMNLFIHGNDDLVRCLYKRGLRRSDSVPKQTSPHDTIAPSTGDMSMPQELTRAEARVYASSYVLLSLLQRMDQKEPGLSKSC